MAQGAWTGLNSIVQGQGRSFKAAEGFLKDYVNDGLVPLNNAVSTYKNLALRGYDTSQIEGIMNAFKDSAAFSRQASYTMGEAIQTASEGLKNENSILVDNAGVTKNVAKMWQDYARSIGTTANNLTLSQKRQAEYIGIMEETKFQMGDATAYTNTYAGKMAQLSTAFLNLKIAVGQLIGPIVTALIPVLVNAMNIVTKFVNRIISILKIFGIEMPMVIDKGTSSVGGFGAGVEQATGDMEKAGKQAGKTAKAINKAFASVDEINVLQTPDNSSSGGSEGGAGADIPETPSLDLDDNKKELSDFEKFIKEKFDNISKIILNSKSWSSLVKTSKNVWKNLKNNILGITETISNTFNMLGAQVANTWNKYKGQFDDGLSKLIEGGGELINAKVNLILAPIRGILQGAQELIAEKGQAFMDSLALIVLAGMEVISTSVERVTGIINTIIEPLETGFYNLYVFFQSVFMDIVIEFGDRIEEIKEKLITYINSVANVWESVAGTIGKIWVGLTSALKNTWDKYGKQIVEGVVGFIITIQDWFSRLWTELLEPIIIPFLEKFQEVWEEHLQPALQEVTDFVGNLISAGLKLWNEFIYPIIVWIERKLYPIWVKVWGYIGNVFNEVFTSIGGTIKGVFKVLNGIIDFIMGVFKGDWKRAWNGIKQVFEGIVKTFTSIFRIPINAIIDLINSAIRGFNKIKLPDWVPGLGGKGINIPEIPKLAQGGYVEANSPRLAIVGDNKREGEIIAPESKIAEAVKRGIEEIRMTAESVTIDLNLKVEYEDGRIMIKKINDVTKTDGKVSLII